MCSARREHLKKGVSFVAERARESASRVDRVIVARLHVSKEMRPPGVREGARRGLLARKASRVGLHASLLLIASQGGSRNGGGLVGGGLVWKMASNGSVELAFSNGLGVQNITKCIFGVNGAPNTP